MGSGGMYIPVLLSIIVVLASAGASQVVAPQNTTVVSNVTNVTIVNQTLVNQTILNVTNITVVNRTIVECNLSPVLDAIERLGEKLDRSLDNVSSGAPESVQGVAMLDGDRIVALLPGNVSVDRVFLAWGGTVREADYTTSYEESPNVTIVAAIVGNGGGSGSFRAGSSIVPGPGPEPGQPSAIIIRLASGGTIILPVLP